MGPTALISLLSAAVCVFAAADPTPSDPNASFSQLAVNEIGPEWPKLQPALAVINATLLPNNTGLHDTRKTVLLVPGATQHPTLQRESLASADP